MYVCQSKVQRVVHVNTIALFLSAAMCFVAALTRSSAHQLEIPVFVIIDVPRTSWTVSILTPNFSAASSNVSHINSTPM